MHTIYDDAASWTEHDAIHFTLLAFTLPLPIVRSVPIPPPLMHGRGEREGTPFPLTRCSLLLGQGGLINVGEALPGAIDGHLPPHADTIIAAGHGQQVSGGRPGHSP